MTDRLDSLREMFRDLGRALSHPYLLIFALGLLLRLVLFYLGSVQTESLEAFATLFPDGRLYAESARAIAADFNWNTQGVQVFGPGYPALLAFVAALTSFQPAWLLFCQILVGSLASVLLAILAFRLTADRAIAWWAGVLHAASLSAISLSNAMLSDCVFMAVLLSGLIQFERAAAENSLRRSAAAGLLLGFAALIRSAGLAVIVMLPFFLLHHEKALSQPWWLALGRSRRVFAVALALTLALPAAWALRNRAVCGVAYISKAKTVAEIRMAAAIQQRIDGTDTEVALAAIGDSIHAAASASPVYERAYVEGASEHFWKRVKSHPGAALRSYASTVDEAAHTDWGGVLLIQLPRWEAGIRDVLHASEKYPLRYRTALSALAGFSLLLFAGRYRLAATLAAIYVLFALTAGLTLWQGNRIFYPGQIAWAILTAVVITTLTRTLRRFGR